MNCREAVHFPGEAGKELYETARKKIVIRSLLLKGWRAGEIGYDWPS